MEAVILIGLQASGKTTFYQQRYLATHVRISLDLLRTRYRERQFLDVCLKTQQPFVIDNTNPTRLERATYIAAAQYAGFTIAGCYFRSVVEECRSRNSLRVSPVPDVGLLGTAGRMERPSIDEGFHALHYVRLGDNGFIVDEWRDEV